MLLGADVEELRALARTLDADGDKLGDLATAANREVTSLDWRGTDSAQFLAEWTSTHLPALKALVAALHAQAVVLDRNATEQDKASAAGAYITGAWRVQGPGASASATGPAPFSLWDFLRGKPWSLGSAEASAWLAKAKGDWEWALGPVTGTLATSGMLGASAKADAELSTKGLRSEASVMAGLHAQAAATARYGLATGKADASLDVGGTANGKVDVTTKGVDVGGEAFAGAKIHAGAEGHVAGIGAKAYVEGWAGAGAAGAAHLTWDGRHLSVGGNLGGAWGLGGKAGASLDVDTEELGDAVGELADDVESEVEGWFR